MKTEFEATFININKDIIREKLKKIRAVLIRPEFLQRRITFNLPVQNSDTTWLRVRDEGDKVTLTLKSVDGITINGQKEILLTVDDFQTSAELLESIGCTRKSYQESKRELWKIGEVEITIDTWPFLDSYVEIEGPNQSSVEEVSQLLDFDYGEAIFDTVEAIYKKKYGQTINDLEQTIKNNFTFNIKNPFIT